MHKKLIITFLLVTFSLLSFVSDVDKTSSEQLNKAFTRSFTVFAISRSLNGLISVVQGTEIYATPAGVGVNFAVGQFVDPMNDMVERFSWVMLMSTVSLGIQEILLSFGQTQPIQWLLFVSVLVLLSVLWIPKLWHKESFNLIFKLFIIISFLRFLVPFIVIVNENVYEYGLQERYEKAKQGLVITQTETEDIVQQIRENKKPESSWWESLNVVQQFENFRIEMETLWRSLENKFNNAIEYILSLIVIFVVQSVLLPFLYIWLFLKIFKNFMAADIATIIERNN